MLIPKSTMKKMAVAAGGAAVIGTAIFTVVSFTNSTWRRHWWRNGACGRTAPTIRLPDYWRSKMPRIAPARSTMR